MISNTYILFQDSTGFPQWILPRDIVVRVSHCRVVLQGLPAAGKTSLVQALMNQPLPDAANSTVLANFRTVRCKTIHGDSSQDPWVDISEDDQLTGLVKLMQECYGWHWHIQNNTICFVCL